MSRRRPVPPGERGMSSVAMTVLLLSALTVTAGAFLSAAQQDLLHSYSYVERTRALLLAEAGVEEALAELDRSNGWMLLDLPEADLYPERAVESGSYWAVVVNNPADPGGAVDTDGILLVRGFGRPNHSGYVAQIEVAYRLPGFSFHLPAAITICGDDTLPTSGGSLSISGFNHDAPPMPCSGAGCNIDPNGAPPDAPGVAFEKLGRLLVVGGHSTVEGVPPQVSGLPELQGPAGLCGHARFLATQIHRLVIAEPLYEWPVKGKDSYGTLDAPKIAYVPKGTTLNLTGTTQGVGVLMLDADVTVDLVGTFTWIGLIIVGPNATLNLKGTVNVAGAMITAGGLQGNPAMIDIRGNVSVDWSKQATNFNSFAIPGLAMSWKEFK